VRAFEHARWERAAPVFAASFATATGQLAEALLDAAAVRAGTHVLDVACGSVAAAKAAAGLDRVPRPMGTRPRHPRQPVRHRVLRVAGGDPGGHGASEG
jgi:hypothetical protein